jgi:long-chain acyl-CoA synthetase
MNTIPEFFRDKVILITGATGFLGKPLVAKILTDLPDIKKIYLLIRSRTEPNGKVRTAADRLEEEIFTSSVFAKLRQIHGTGFDGWIREKVCAVDGDLAEERLGLSDSDYERLKSEVRIFINSGGLVKFDPSIDASLRSNTLGAKYAVEFAKRCNDAVLIHLSTAYVCGMRPGKVVEALHPPYETYAERHRVETGETIPSTLEADIEDILQLSEGVRAEAHHSSRTVQFRREAQRQVGGGKRNSQKLDGQIETVRNKWIEARLVEEGLKRAKSRGWNDTYTYTKSLGEQMIDKVKGDLPTAIVRPSIIESSLEEPEPGWLDGFRMADPIIIGFAKGRLLDFPGKPEAITDIIPVDLVVNAILAITFQTYRKRGIEVYHVATGSRNPLSFHGIVTATHDYFAQSPLLDKGKPIAVPVWKYPSLEKFQRQLRLKYLMLGVSGRILSLFPLKSAAQANRRIGVMQNAIEGLQNYIRLYGTYTRLSFEFETDKTEGLFRSLTPSDQQRFNFDVSRFDWRHYLQEVHIPGIKRHILKLERDERQKPVPERSEEGNGSRVDDASDNSQFPYRTIPDLIADRANAYPNKTALQMKTGDTWVRYSYRQLYDFSRRIACSLWNRGYRTGDRVILFAENQPEWGIAYLGATQIGITVVPVDRQTPEREMFALAKFTGARAILTSETIASHLHRVLLQSADETPSVALLNINRLCQPFEFEYTTESQSPSIEGSDPVDNLPEITDDFPDVDIQPDTIASIIFTAGTTVEAKGVMLSHKSFIANVLAVAQALPPRDTDQFLSILPLHHALEFTCCFLMSIYGGATATYPNTLKPTVVLETMQETKTTVVIGVPRMFKLIYDTIMRYVVKSLADADSPADVATVEAFRAALGGNMRVLVSGGAALSNEIYDEFQRFGLTIYQGYGLTETAPVLTVNPHHKSKRASVGVPVRGTQVQIHRPNPDGIGEIIAQGPSLMAGYYRNPGATGQMMREGTLYTGDLGYIDADGYLYITGRLKDVIVSSAGKNIYPVELEELYRHSPDIAEICVVGVNIGDTHGEEVHAVILPNRRGKPNLAEVEVSIRQHLQTCARNLPSYQHLHRVHFWESELPKLPTFEIHRRRVKEMLLEQLSGKTEDDTPTAESVTAASHEAPSSTQPDWISEGWEGAIAAELSRLSRLPLEGIRMEDHLDSDLGLDSLARVELLLLLEAKLQLPIPDEMVTQIRTVGDVIQTVKTLQAQPVLHNVESATAIAARAERPSYAEIGPPHLSIKTRLLRFGMRIAYKGYFSIKTYGKAHIPREQPCIFVANHSSHLDTGAVVTALGKAARGIKILAARDYFFNTRFKAWFFGKLFKFLPFERKDNFSQFLRDVRTSHETMLENRCLLIYPEGTRSVTGELQPFKAGLGLLAYETGAPIVPTYIHGTYQALPKGKHLPRRKPIKVVFGEPMTLHSSQGGATINHEVYRAFVDEVRGRIEELRANMHNTLGSPRAAQNISNWS